MAYYIEMLIVVVLLIIIFLVGFYNRMSKKNNDITCELRNIMQLFHSRNALAIELLDIASIYMIKDERLFNLIRDEIRLCKVSNETQELANHLFLLSEYIKELITSLPSRDHENVTNYIRQLEELEKQIQLSWYQYNKDVSAFNRWIHAFPQRIVASFLGVEKLKLILYKEEWKGFEDV